MIDSVQIFNIRKAMKNISKNQKKVGKSYRTAAKVEGYRLRRALMRDLARGRAGNESFGQLTTIGRYWSDRSKRRKPLAALARAVTYSAKGGYNGEKFELAVGFTDRTGTAWRRIAMFQQRGGRVKITSSTRRSLKRVGAGFSKRSRLRKYFFLRKTTTTFKVPARPIIEPFWRVHEDEAWRNIRKNFRKKMKGQRI